MSVLKWLSLIPFLLIVPGCGNSNTCDECVKMSYSRGWVDGVNAASGMLKNGNYSKEQLLYLHYEDSLRFSDMIDGVEE
jgi:hypothetical protein